MHLIIYIMSRYKPFQNIVQMLLKLITSTNIRTAYFISDVNYF